MDTKILAWDGRIISQEMFDFREAAFTNAVVAAAHVQLKLCTCMACLGRSVDNAVLFERRALELHSVNFLLGTTDLSVERGPLVFILDIRLHR